MSEYTTDQSKVKPGLYQASPIKRVRSTKAEVEARREALLAIIEARQADDSAAGVLSGHRPRHRREGRDRLHQGADRSHQDAARRIAAV